MPSSQREIDRGDRPLAFEGRGYAAPPPPRGGPAPVTLIASLVILAVVGGGVFYLYRSGVRAPSGPPAPVGAPVGDIRVAAPPQAPQADPAAGLSVYKDDPNAAAAAPKFAPPPEQPATRPQAPAAAPIGASVLYPVTANPAPSAAQAATQPAAPATPVKAAKTPTIDTILAANTTAPAKPLVKAKPLADAVPAAAPAVAKAEAKPAPKTGEFVVQIGAFSSEALADKSWNQAAGAAPGQMAGKGKRVAALAKNGATLYRTSITGFSTRAEAESLCAKLTAAGRTCFVR
jgi:hypothetical protein